MSDSRTVSRDVATPPGGGAGPRPSGWVLAVAIAVLSAFGVMVAYLVGQAGADERTWTRLAWLLSSVEAIAFGAAGALFGASIQRDRAEAAEHRAAKNERDAVAGRTLAETIKAGASRAEPPGGDTPGLAATGAKSAAELLRDAGESPVDPYVALARRLFPD